MDEWHGMAWHDWARMDACEEGRKEKFHYLDRRTDIYLSRVCMYSVYIATPNWAWEGGKGGFL